MLGFIWDRVNGWGNRKLVGLFDLLGIQINPATEDKQDDIIALLQQIVGSGVIVEQIYNEIPSGLVNGVNDTFLLDFEPTGESLELYVNGQLQTKDVNYNISGKQIVFVSDSIPQTNQIVRSYYKKITITSNIGTSVNNETPSGTINSINSIFTLTNTPITNSLKLYVNGQLQTEGVDYTLSTNTITFVLSSIPQTGQIIRAYYVYT